MVVLPFWPVEPSSLKNVKQQILSLEGSLILFLGLIACCVHSSVRSRGVLGLSKSMKKICYTYCFMSERSLMT